MKSALKVALSVLLAASPTMLSAFFSTSAFAQSPAGSSTPAPDTAIVFESPRPLLEREQTAQNPLDQTLGFSVFFSDYGFGIGSFYGKQFSNDVTGLISIDIGGAKGPKEFGFDNEIKINRILVVPLMAGAQVRLLANTLGENLRPYITAGAGPVFILTTPGDRDFIPGLGAAKVKTLPGGFVGAGANFGLDKKSTFGANLRYYIIPYPSPGLESTKGVFLNNFNGLFLSANYGFNF